MTNNEFPTVCIVEDDPVLCFLMREICKAAGFKVLATASDIAGASCMLDNRLPDILLLDYSLDGGDDGMELLSRIKRDYPGLATVLVTGWDLQKLAARLDYVAPDYHMQKPVLPRELSRLLIQIDEAKLQPELAEAA
ncbi:response regulator [Qipengyuania sp. 1NDH17]|uniref:Response regulator n=1 Tax=Qipengyuania polymorpha TaxID=2867234 RepID=A0ABS7IZT1_9SPHN|nr:response regulator [Qipengyuania polymorpha]MBX7458953.1 response regulator [Qipengyuania polymorpha]